MALVQYPQITGDGLGSAPRPPLRLEAGSAHPFSVKLAADRLWVSMPVKEACSGS
jgi:hypothetical protein